jgi:hypothetical protein
MRSSWGRAVGRSRTSGRPSDVVGGATGARILTTLIHALKHRGLERGVASLCIGGGEATAIAIELM